MNRQELAHQLAYQFAAKDWKWGATIPEEEDFLNAFEWIDNNLEEGNSMFVGRLAVTKSEGHTDIYIYQGELE